MKTSTEGISNMNSEISGKRSRFESMKQGKASDTFQAIVHTNSSSDVSEHESLIQMQDLNKNNNGEEVIGAQSEESLVAEYVADHTSSDTNSELLSLCLNISDGVDSVDGNIDHDNVWESIYPVVKHKLIWSVDAFDDISSLEPWKSETEDNVRPMAADTCKDHHHRPFKGATKGVRFLGSLSSNHSAVIGELTEDVPDAAMNRNGSLEPLITTETFENETFGDNSRFGGDIGTIIHRGSETMIKKHANVLNEIKLQAKAAKREQNEVKRIQKSRFCDVLLELKCHSLVSFIAIN